MSNLPAHTLLKEAATCFTEARKNVYDGTALLYEIQQKEAWEGMYSSFSEYVEQECQLTRGYASKLIQAWEFYVVNGGVPKRQLVGIDAEKLYLSTRLPSGSVEQRLVRAVEWNREQLRAELAVTDGKECEHDRYVKVCVSCGKRVD